MVFVPKCMKFQEERIKAGIKSKSNPHLYTEQYMVRNFHCIKIHTLGVKVLKGLTMHSRVNEDNMDTYKK